MNGENDNVVALRPAKTKAKQASESNWRKDLMKLRFSLFPSLPFRAQRCLGLNPTQLAVLIQRPMPKPSWSGWSPPDKTGVPRSDGSSRRARAAQSVRPIPSSDLRERLGDEGVHQDGDERPDQRNTDRGHGERQKQNNARHEREHLEPAQDVGVHKRARIPQYSIRTVARRLENRWH
jgi:hypothetical protein